MNERIRELIKEVVDIEIDPDSKMETIYTCGPEDFEAFAELIVQECGVALNPPVQNRNVISRGQAYDLIKKHFGVGQ